MKDTIVSTVKIPRWLVATEVLFTYDDLPDVTTLTILRSVMLHDDDEDLAKLEAVIEQRNGKLFSREEVEDAGFMGGKAELDIYYLDLDL